MGTQAYQRTDYERIAQAVRFIQSNWREQPPLKEIARAAHMSEFHFQRLFTRWVGISPKRYVQFLTIDRARAILRDAASVLDTSFDVGLSGPSRLHDLFVSIEAVTPGEYKLGGAGLRIDFGVHDSPFGRCLIGVTDRGVCWLAFVDQDNEAAAMDAFRETWPNAALQTNQARVREIVERIFRLDPQHDGTPIKLLVCGTNFQLKVWEALIRVPAGQVVSYQQLAAAVGQEKAARAVGRALAVNHIAWLIPCHRVIRSDGDPGDYRWGVTRKSAMLTWESARSEAPASRSK
ncbi:MAG: methylated-DNA--[protein]-cysteine S-methyltransferase [Myxococcales bacterium]|nr:MAG: methylated-DNA--[protein]-cysteine S-methyltransferase [Myxococcales bacterium]